MIFPLDFRVFSSTMKSTDVQKSPVTTDLHELSIQNFPEWITKSQQKSIFKNFPNDVIVTTSHCHWGLAMHKIINMIPLDPWQNFCNDARPPALWYVYLSHIIVLFQILQFNSFTDNFEIQYDTFWCLDFAAFISPCNVYMLTNVCNLLTCWVVQGIIQSATGPYTMMSGVEEPRYCIARILVTLFRIKL